MTRNSAIGPIPTNRTTTVQWSNAVIFYEKLHFKAVSLGEMTMKVIRGDRKFHCSVRHVSYPISVTMSLRMLWASKCVPR